ncbi:GumC family protein [Oricola sp.]|uniref:GumC family protein n=1 Tax=Oricola sp. TaxID=1979950 RepID=UPI003BA882D2
MNELEPGGAGHNVAALTRSNLPRTRDFEDERYDPYSEEEEDGIDPLQLLWYAIKYRWLIATLLAAGIVVGVLVTYVQTPLYRATTNVEVIPPGAKIIQDLELVSQSADIRAFETAREKVHSRDLARRVVFTLGLAEDEAFLAPRPSFSIMNLVHRVFGYSPSASIAHLDAEERELMAVDKLVGGLSVNLIRNTSILSVSYSHADPKYAAGVSLQTVRSFIDQNVDKTAETSDLARQFIEEQVQETKVKLQASEEALVAYAKQAGITLTGNNASLISENISKLNEALSQALQQHLVAGVYAQQIEEGDAASLPDVFQSESIRETRQLIVELKANYQEKLTTLKPGFPEMRRLQSQISELQKQVDAEIAAIARAVQIRFVQSEEKISALEDEIAEFEAEQADFLDKNIQYTILQREVESNRAQYETLISKLNEVGVGSDLKTANASIIDPAVVPREPYSPSLRLNLALCLVVFLALAAGIAYLLELLRNTFAVPDQIEAELKVPVLGIVPLVPDGDVQDAMQDSKSSLSEAYRSLRTSIQFTGVGDSMFSVLVTSSERGDGKTTTAYKLAQDFGALGKKVLVVDADMRSPRMHKMFGADNKAGLSNMLSNVLQEGDVTSILQQTTVPNVTLLTAGTIPPNPVELLMSKKMEFGLARMTKSYDIVVLDAPPVLGLADAPVLSRLADATVFVVPAERVTRKAAKHALKRLQSASAKVVGAAYTKFAIDRLDYSYAYRYSQYAYYSYHYGAIELEHDKGQVDGGASGKRKTGITGRLVRGGTDFVSRFKRSSG